MGDRDTTSVLVRRDQPMILQTVIEVLRGGKVGDRHWVPDNQFYEGEELDPVTGCGLNASGMVSDHIDNPQRLTCLECRTQFAVTYLVRKG